MRSILFHKVHKRKLPGFLFVALVSCCILTYLSQVGQKEVIHAATIKPKVTISMVSSWYEQDKRMTQFNVSLKNTNDSSIPKWELEFFVPNGAKVNNSWNGEFVQKSKTLRITPMSYNTTIESGGLVEFGFIIGTDKVFKPKVVKFNDDNITFFYMNSLNAVTNIESNKNTTTKTTSDPDTDSGAGANSVVYKPNKGAIRDDDWLFTDGNKIIDKDGKEVWITGINWFGYNTGTNTFDGLWSCNLEKTLQSIANHGFNLIRIPISTELIQQWSKKKYPKANFNEAINPNLVGKNSLEIFDLAIQTCQKVGLKIMIDFHSANTDSMGHMENMWYTDKISTKQYYNALSWIAKRYKKDDTIIAYDLKNEPHGKPEETNFAIWNHSTNRNNWKYVAEQAAGKILAKNPNVLIMIEGIEVYPKNSKKNNFTSKKSADYYYNWWGGNLRGVADYPIDLGKYQNKLVYSPHDYGPAVYQQPWFQSGYNYKSLMKDCWKDNWFYIYEDEIAPLLIGEWGGYMTQPNLTWMKHLRTLIKKYKINHTFWCFNNNSGDTGGMVGSDFVTWDQKKYRFVKAALWQKKGKFVGLDHKVPLGQKGINLSDY